MTVMRVAASMFLFIAIALGVAGKEFWLIACTYLICSTLCMCTVQIICEMRRQQA